MATIPERLRHLRGRMSQTDFAKKTGISRRSLLNYEQGLRIPNSLAVEKICAQTGVSSDWLLFGKDDPVASKLGPVFADLINTPSNLFVDGLVERRKVIFEHLSQSQKITSEWLSAVYKAQQNNLDFSVDDSSYFKKEAGLEKAIEGFSEYIHNAFRTFGEVLLFGDTTTYREQGSMVEIADVGENIKKQPTEIIESQKNKTADGGGFPLHEEIRALEKELRVSIRENADLRVEREQLLAENDRLKQGIQQLEMELDDYRTGKARLVLPVATDEKTKGFTVEEPSTSYQYKRGTPPLQEPTPPYSK